MFLPLGGGGLRALRQDTPAATVIDLSRLPSQGRDVALVLRQQKSTRHIPLIFVDGDPEKVSRVKALLPDAAYTTWAGIGDMLNRAIASPPSDPVVPRSALAGYSGTPLPRKLGIKTGSTVALVGAPPGFAATLGVLPEGATLRAGARGRPDLTIWFVRSRKDLTRDIRRMPKLAAGGGLWIAWPKRASTLAADVSETDVREAGLASGLVDYKICAIDATWSGLKFTLRKHR